MSMVEVAADISKAIQRAAGAKGLEFRVEAVNNVYPLMQAMLEAIDERFQDLEAALAEVAENTDGGPVGLSRNAMVALQAAFVAADAIRAFTATLDMTDEQKAQFVALDKEYMEAVEKAADAMNEEVIDDDDDEEDEDDVDDEDADEEEDQ